MAWLESLVESRRATRTEWLALHHFQRRLERARRKEQPMRGLLTFSVMIESQQAAEALAFMRALRS